MPTNQWLLAKELFRAALDLTHTEREAYLKAQCRDEIVLADVVELLRLHEAEAQFLRSPIEVSKPEVETRSDPLMGYRVADYLITKRIGAGGMGVVYEARQENPQRRAAVKVLRPGYASREMLRRFEFESQVLGKLQHPGIAHIYAAGTFDRGDGPQPWFAMELIEGETLNVFVRSRKWTVRQKLELLLGICDAVQHAHQRGIVHRDLKPANILVTASGQTKILDFGVARAMDSEMRMTLHTAVGELVGTLSYMSPEQLGGDPDQIDARCDVYSLGAIAYELLAGHLPHERSSTVAETIRAIEHDEPKRLGSIHPALRGDIETIFGKALEKDRQRRYQSVAELAADLRRHLNNEPVLARPATPFYQLQKFARRNRSLVGGVAATMLALVAGLVLYAREARQAHLEAERAQYEADKATAINNFMTNDFLMKVLAAANSPDATGRLPVVRMVNQAAEKIGAMFAAQPLAEAAVRNEVASIYYNLGAFEQSAAQFQTALHVWEAKLGPDHPDTLKAVNNLGQCMAKMRRFAEAEALYRRAVESRMRVLGENNTYTLVSMNNLANLLRFTGRLEEAERMLRRTLAAQQRLHGSAHTNTIITMSNLGTLLLDRGLAAEAVRLHREAYETSRQTLGEDHVTTLTMGYRLGKTLCHELELEQAEALLSRVVDGLDRVVGPDHIDTITARQILASVYSAQNRKKEAIQQLQRAARSCERAKITDGQLVKSIQSELNALIVESGDR